MRCARYWIAVAIAVCITPCVTAGQHQVTLTFPSAGNPSVTINAAGVSGWLVDVNFNLAYPEGAPCDISLEYKRVDEDNDSWTEADALMGDIHGIYPGTLYSLTWNAQADIPSANGEQYNIRITASCGILTGSAIHTSTLAIPSMKFITIVNFEREDSSGCYTISHTYNEYVGSYSIFWTDGLLSDTTNWNEIPYQEFVDEVQTIMTSEGIYYTWTDCGDPAASVPRPEPDNDSVRNRHYYLKAD